LRVLVTVPWGERLGGAETMLQGILDAAPASGHEVELVFLRPGPWPQELLERDLRVEVIDAGRLRQVGRWASSVRKLARVLERRRPDLILAWAAKTHLYTAPAAMLAGMSDRLLWWQHAIPGPRGWLDACATLLPARAIGCTSAAAARGQARYRPRRPTFVVAAGAPEPRAGAPAPALELPAGVPVVGIVGRLQPWKGQSRLLEAQALLRERGHRLHLLIVGGDSYGLAPEYASGLSPLVDRLGLRGEVTMTGEVPDAGPYIARMDVLVNASDPEPFGIVLLEGMARGVAVLAVDSGGPPEFIRDGRTGVLARSGEPGDLADALAPVLASPELRARLAAAGRESFLADYTEAAMARRFFAALEALLEDPLTAAVPRGSPKPT
jgi:glycosyltransferase involved in cell wall biosynthesis